MHVFTTFWSWKTLHGHLQSLCDYFQPPYFNWLPSKLSDDLRMHIWVQQRYCVLLDPPKSELHSWRHTLGFFNCHEIGSQRKSTLFAPIVEFDEAQFLPVCLCIVLFWIFPALRDTIFIKWIWRLMRTQSTGMNKWKNSQSCTRQNLKWIEGFATEIYVLNSKSLRAPTLICLTLLCHFDLH